MHIRRVVMLILGCWFGITAAMLFVATQNFAGVDRLLEKQSDGAKKVLSQLDPAQRRMLLRYEASEFNRFYFDSYLSTEIILGLILTFNLVFATNANRVMLGISLAAIGVVLFQRFFMFPEIQFLGRVIDFLPPDAASAERSRFWTFHLAFSALEIVKILLLLLIAIKMVVRSDTRRRNSRVGDPDTEAVEIR